MEFINKNLIFNKDNWKLNLENFIKDINFYGKSIKVELNDKIGSFYLIEGGRYINAMPKKMFNISEFNKISVSLKLSSMKLKIKLYILEFSDKEKIVTKLYELKEDINIINHTLNEESQYIKIAFRVEVLESYSMFMIDSLNIDCNLEKNIVIPSITHTVDSSKFKLGESTYTIKESNMEFNYYLNYKDSKKIVISLPGAINRAKRIYNFQRYSWSNSMEYSFMSILDPTVHEKNELEIGWFQGKHDNYPLVKLVDLLKKLFKINNINENDVLFFGSSAGGFTSLQLSNFFPLSKVLVINPQIDIDRYYKNKYNQVLEYSYSGMDTFEVKNRFMNRISVDIDFSKRVAPVYYYQNQEDAHHLKHHLKRFLDRIDDKSLSKEMNINDEFTTNKKLYIVLYSDIKKRHAPPDKEKSLEIIEKIFNHQYREHI